MMQRRRFGEFLADVIWIGSQRCRDNLDELEGINGTDQTIEHSNRRQRFQHYDDAEDFRSKERQAAGISQRYQIFRQG